MTAFFKICYNIYMKHSNKINIAVHIMAYAYLRQDVKLSSNMIANSLNVNAVTVRQITSLLSKAGLIQTQSGSGKIKLNYEPKQITFFDIFQAVNDKEIFYRHDSTNIDCPIGQAMPSVLNYEYNRIEEVVYKEMKQIVLQDVIDRLLEKK